MAARRVTIDDVAKAMAALASEGERATVDAIRRRTGGSNTTILKLLRRLEERDAVTAPGDVAVAPEDLPPAILHAQDALSQAIAAVVAGARAEERRSARAEIDAVRAELAVAVKRAEAERKTAGDLAAESDRVRGLLDSSQAEAAAAKERERQLQARLEALMAERERLAAQVDDLIGQLKDAVAAQARAEARLSRKTGAAASRSGGRDESSSQK